MVTELGISSRQKFPGLVLDLNLGAIYRFATQRSTIVDILQIFFDPSRKLQSYLLI